MQTHQDIWFSVSNEEEHIYFRARHLPTPVLDFIPWPIRVRGIIFPDDSEITSTGSAQTPWLQNIDGAGYTLNNANFTNVTVNGRPLTNVFELKGSVPTQDDLPSNASMGDVWITQDTGFLYVWDGSQWVDLGPAGSSFQTPWLSNIDAAGFALTNLGYIVLNNGPIYNAGQINCRQLQVQDNINPTTQVLLGSSSSNSVGLILTMLTDSGSWTFQAFGSAVSGFAGDFVIAPGPGVHSFYFGNASSAQVKVGINLYPDATAQFALDVNGIINTSSCYYVSDVPFACSNGAGGINLSNISTINGAAPGSQTPWLSDIDGAGHALTDVEYVQVNGDVNITGEYLVNGVPISTGAFNPQAHDVTGIRSAVTQYGPFPQARFVSVFFELIGASDNAFLNLLLPGQVTAIPVAGTGTGAEPQTGFLFGLVPAGAAYVVDTAMAITTWVEYY